MTWPKGLADNLKGKILATPAHVIDIMPTCLDIANGLYPKQYNGNKITPAGGISLFPLAKGKDVQRKQPIFWEHEGNRAMRDGNWKIVSNVGEHWQLYNMADDRTELHDLAKEKPDVLNQMVKDYEVWYKKVGARPYFTEPKKWQIRMGTK
jgi:arylsulfatase